MSDEGTQTDDRIAALEKRVTELEAAVRMMVAAAEEFRRIEQATDDLKAKPARTLAEFDRVEAAMAAGVILRPILAAATPEQRAQAIAEGPPAHSLATLAQASHLAALRTQLLDVAEKAREHALTWDDLGVAAVIPCALCNRPHPSGPCASRDHGGNAPVCSLCRKRPAVARFDSRLFGHLWRCDDVPTEGGR